MSFENKEDVDINKLNQLKLKVCLKKKEIWEQEKKQKMKW